MRNDRPRRLLTLCLALVFAAGALPAGRAAARGLDAFLPADLDPAIRTAIAACVAFPEDADAASAADCLRAVTELTLEDPAQPVRSLAGLSSALPGLTRLTVQGGTPDSLTPLADLAALQSLTLTDCPALDLGALADCPKLNTLTIAWSEGFASGASYDLTPLAQCARLSTLSLSGGCVSDLAPLKTLPKLTTLSLERVSAEDYSPVGTLSGLVHIRLYGAPGAQVAAAFEGLGRKLTSAYVGDCTLTPEANAAILGCTRLQSLGFDQVQGVDADAAGWAKATSLTTLWMKGGALSDLAFLAPYAADTVVKLEGIAVGAQGTECTVDFDKYFITLTNVPSEQAALLLSGETRRWNYATLRMDAGAVGAEVIAALASVPGLLSLDAQRVAADAFTAEAWTGFASLQQLKLSDCEQADLRIADGLPALARLSLSRCAASGMDSVASRRKLTQISLTACRVENWAFLDALSCGRTLTSLAISQCGGPDSAAFVAALPNLTTLALEDSGVTDLNPLANLQALDALYLYGAPVTDFTPLEALPALKLLSCGEGATLPPEMTCRVERRRYIAAP